MVLIEIVFSYQTCFIPQPTILAKIEKDYRNSNPIERRSFTHCITSLTFTFRVLFYKLIPIFHLLLQLYNPKRDRPLSPNKTLTPPKHPHCFPFSPRTSTPTNHERQIVWNRKMRRVTDSHFQENAHPHNTQLFPWKQYRSTYWLIFEIHRALDLSDGDNANSSTLVELPFASEESWLNWGDSDLYR